MATAPVAGIAQENSGSGGQDTSTVKYEIGVLAGLEWSPVPNAELETLEINALKELVKQGCKRDYPARLVEIIAAWEPLDVETPIATPCGWKTMGDMVAGDYVYGADGRIRSVTVAHPVQQQSSYVILFSDGTRIIAGGTHTWMTTTCKERSVGKSAIERSTKDLFDTQDRQHAIGIMPGLQMFESSLPIDPYLLGCWLGDGIAASGEICGGEKDLTEIVSNISGAKIRKKVSREYGDYCLATIPGFRDALYRLNLLKNKHIPETYLRASHEQRVALLQGLMDTDGSVTANGGCSWGQYKGHKGLIDSFSELLTTLGVKHQFHSYKRTRQTREEEFEFWQTTFSTDIAAFRLKRKAQKQVKPKGNRTKLLYITGVEEVGVRDVRCITVDAPDHLFLAGKSMIPTHNCALFYRGFQFLIPQRGGGWVIPGESTGYGPSMQMDLSLLPTNIYSARGQMIIAALTRTVPGVIFSPQDANNDAGIAASESAAKFSSVIRRNNDLIKIQTDGARYLWTDGRYLYWNRFVKDGQAFGWEEDDEQDNVIPENEPADEGQPTNVEQAAAAGTPESAETAQEAGSSGASPQQTQVTTVEHEAADASYEETGSDMDSEEEEETEPSQVKRTPRGQEVRTSHGKLEVKLVPMMANELKDCDMLIYEDEVDVTRAKGMMPWVADDIKASERGAASSEIARLARQNVKLGMQSTYVTADSVACDVTIQRTWMRPSQLMGIGNKQMRDKLIAMFPNGLLFVQAGEVFCYARNESMDDSWALCQAYSGDGQNRNAMGTSTMPIQKRLNNWLDLMNDIFVRTIPKKWMDAKVFDVTALRGQTNVPGDVGSFKRVPGVSTSELVFVEPEITPPQGLADFIKEYSGPLAELLSGAYPALAGGDVGTADSGVAIATQRDSALGRLAPTWHQIKNCEAVSMKQLVRWGAKCRDKSINEKIPGGETIQLESNDMKGNILCFAESDENFPETYTQTKNAVMQVFQESAKSPQLQEVLYNPANLELLQKTIGLKDFYVKEVAARNKQLGEIEIMLKTGPVPNPQVEMIKQKAQAMTAAGVDPAELAQVAQAVASMPPEVSSIDVDPIEDHVSEAATLWQFLMSEEGRKAKKQNKDGYTNCRLHFMEHDKLATQNAQDQAAAAQQKKPPSVSINYKDANASDITAGQQILQQAGISTSPGAGTPPPVPAPVGAKGPAAPLPLGPPSGAGGLPKH